ncbi:MAG: V-type ATP synthase subunit D [Parcubacteria group bacterium CG11_big_fil_rev_8_21_14_0_20_39_22]|nr:MAG: V-type ATP synthase subunit D [Parcubacteria group bacterium CG11_big_fil_rev_8_21_14_0_20_39_22]
MILKVNPTRINLLNLKKELKVAKRGHKLLKDKRDGLMKKFMVAIYEVKDLRSRVETELGEVFKHYVRGSALMSQNATENAFLLPSAKISVEVSNETVMSVPTPRFSLTKKGNLFSYGLLETNAEIDTSVSKLDKSFADLIALAELEKTIENLAAEIERTRRRASALENTKIPNLNDTIKFITMRLEEQARDTIVGTMRIKAMIVAKEESVN